MTNQDNKEDSKENLDNNQEDNKHESKPNQEREYTELEQVAIEAGWDPNGKKDAKPFLLDGYKVRNQKITDMYKIVESIKELQQQQEQTIREKVRAEFKAERENAIKQGDVQRVNEIDLSEAERLRQEEINRYAMQFKKRNSDWWDSNDPQCIDMKIYAAEADRLVGGANAQEHYNLVEKAIKRKFKDYFDLQEEEPAPKKPRAVESSTKSPVVKTGGKKVFTYDDLNKDQKYWCDLYAKRNIMTVDKYIEEQVKAGNLK